MLRAAPSGPAVPGMLRGETRPPTASCHGLGPQALLPPSKSSEKSGRAEKLKPVEGTFPAMRHLLKRGSSPRFQGGRKPQHRGQVGS